MLEKLKNLSTAAKVGIASGAALLTVAGVGVGITQPWKQNDPPPEDPPAADQQQTVQQPAQQEEKQLSVRAGNDVGGFPPLYPLFPALRFHTAASAPKGHHDTFSVPGDSPPPRLF